MISTLAITLGIALILVTALLLHRVLPVVKGTARAGDSRDESFIKWNSFIMPMMRRHLEKGMQCGLAGTFNSRIDGEQKSVATWSLQPTLLPDVDYIAIARATDGDDAAPEVFGFIEAEVLREFLQDRVQMQTMFGHITWIYVWPDDVDFDEFAAQLMQADAFREQYGLSKPDEDQEEEES